MSKLLTCGEQLATARGFCEVARLFFASLTERYLNYFISP